MAQLRCAQTSELLFEGTPLEVATVAANLDLEDVMYDDVGEGFDPGKVRDAAQINVEGLKRARSETDDLDEQQRFTDLIDEHISTVDLARSRASEAATKMNEARARTPDEPEPAPDAPPPTVEIPTEPDPDAAPLFSEWSAPPGGGPQRVDEGS